MDTPLFLAEESSLVNSSTLKCSTFVSYVSLGILAGQTNKWIGQQQPSADEPVTERLNCLQIMVVRFVAQVFLLLHLEQKPLDRLGRQLTEAAHVAAAYDLANTTHGQSNVLVSILPKPFLKCGQVAFNVRFAGISSSNFFWVDETLPFVVEPHVLVSRRVLRWLVGR